ncbi:hypothetical protein D3C83_277490 [compost metagenome]
MKTERRGLKKGIDHDLFRHGAIAGFFEHVLDLFRHLVPGKGAHDRRHFFDQFFEVFPY